ncbi:MAG: 2-dehydro-3-deoxygalactonokinase [Thalassovita sp.]
MQDISWVALDWGTSNMRAYAIDSAGAVLASSACGAGMSTLTKDQFEPTLLSTLKPWLRRGSPLPVLACGMVGAAQGWQEAPYRSVPTKPVEANALIHVPVQSAEISVSIIPGLSQPHPEDVMRGEETQIAGFLATHPTFDGIICLPGTHSKWVHVTQGLVRKFTTFMTGELFSLLSRHSVLRHSMNSESWHEPSFHSGVSASLEDPKTLTTRLFGLRPQSLLSGKPPAHSKATLSGYLIGTELAATQSMWSQNPVVLIGAAQNMALYAQALESQGVTPTQVDAAEATIMGMTQLMKQSGHHPAFA